MILTKRKAKKNLLIAHHLSLLLLALPTTHRRRRRQRRRGQCRLGRNRQLVSHLDVLGRFVEETQVLREIALAGEDARTKLAVKDLRNGGGRIRAVEAFLVLLVVASLAELGATVDAGERQREGVQAKVLFEIFVRRVGLFTDGAFDAAGFDDLLILGAANLRRRSVVIGRRRRVSVDGGVLSLGGAGRQIQHVDQFLRESFHRQDVLELGVDVYPGFVLGCDVTRRRRAGLSRFVMAAHHGPGRVGWVGSVAGIVRQPEFIPQRRLHQRVQRIPKPPVRFHLVRVVHVILLSCSGMFHLLYHCSSCSTCYSSSTSSSLRPFLLNDPITFPTPITEPLEFLQGQRTFPADGTGKVLLVANLNPGPLVDLLDQLLVVVTPQREDRHYFRLGKAQPAVRGGIIGWPRFTYTSHTVCIAIYRMLGKSSSCLAPPR